MGNQAEQDPNAKFRYEDVEVFKVDLVGGPATRDKFMVIRSENEGETMPRRAMTREAVEALRRNNQANEGVPVVARQEAVDDGPRVAVTLDGKEIVGAVIRQVPPSDATTDRKRKAQEKRSEKYGIEALENKGENLSYPSGDPTTESLYGDPANLKYPLGRDDNELDIDRANNARARFKQAFKVYSKTESRRAIHTRIVQAQLKGGANPSYDPDDPLDRLLPKEVKDKLTQSVERTEEPETDSEETQMKNLNEGIGRLEKLVERMEGVFTGALGALGTPDAAGETETEDIVAEPEAQPESEITATAEPEAEVRPETEPETSQGASDGEQAATEVDTPTTAENPVDTPAPAASGDIEALGQSVAGLTAVVERMGQTFQQGFETLNDTVQGLTGRVNKVERSVRSGGNAEEDSTEGPIERGTNGSKASLWTGIL